MKKQCVRCGRGIPDEYSKLWCDTCRERVNEELSGKANRPFQYYFRFNLKKIKDDKNQMQQQIKGIRTGIYKIAATKYCDECKSKAKADSFRKRKEKHLSHN